MAKRNKMRVGWVDVEVMTPPEGFVLLCIEPEQAWTQRYLDLGWWDGREQVWRTRLGRVRGQVTHWAELPAMPRKNGTQMDAD